jgi:hypothetical protein
MLRQAKLGILVIFAVSIIVLDGESLTAPDFKLTITASWQAQAVPKFQNGYVVAHDPATVLLPRVYLHSRTGVQLMQAQIAIPGAYREVIKDVSISSTGIVAVAGKAYTNDGAQAWFIAWVDPNGLVEKVVRTSPFAVEQICFAQDGSLWAAGIQVTTDFKNEEDEYDVLRHYDSEGHFLQSLLPRSSYTRGVVHNSIAPGEHGYLLATGDHIAYYSPTALEWDEVSASGSVLKRTPALKAVAAGFKGPVKAFGAAILASGAAYISAHERDSSGKQFSSIYRFDPATASWQAVTTSQIGKAGDIIGSDGDELVIYKSAANILWAKVQ